MDEPIIIEVAQRLMDKGTFHVQIKDRPDIWGCGKSWPSAVGDLVLSHPEVIGVKVVDLGMQAR